MEGEMGMEIGRERGEERDGLRERERELWIVETACQSRGEREAEFHSLCTC